MENKSIRRIVGPTILLRGGEYFDFIDPESCAFTIEDIAHALSLICRFGGHCSRHYSVAQHSIHVSNILPSHLQLAGLMHDAPEFAIGDVVKPLKVLLPDFTAIERRVETAVFSRFSIGLPLDPMVKEADAIMLATEQVQLMSNRDDWNYTRGQIPLDMELPVMTHEEARNAFLMRFNELRNT